VERIEARFEMFGENGKVFSQGDAAEVVSGN
jgi:hypothetical protein